MKITKILTLVSVVVIAFACVKNDEKMPPNDITSSASIDRDNIQCIDGTLHFPSPESCFKTVDAISTDDALHKFEKEYNFKSVRSFTDDMLDEMIACETPEEYAATLESCAGYLAEKDGRLMPTIASFGYASIADLNGVFYVDEIKHTVSDDKILIETKNSSTRASVLNEFDYICSTSETGVATRGETGQKYFDNRYETKKYKVFGRTLILRMVIARDAGNGNTAYESSFAMELHISGQKKKTLIGWNTYKDNFTIDRLSFNLWIGGRQFRFNPGYAPFTATSGNTKDYKLRIPIGGMWIGSQAVPMPIPANFYMIRWRALSGSLGNCGAVTEQWNIGMPTPLLPLSNCM